MEKLFIDYLLPLFAGWLLDLKFGDPEKLPHPVVYMGKWIAFFEKKLNRNRYRMTKGATFALVSVVLTFTFGWLLQKMTVSIAGENLLTTIVTVLLKTVLVFFCLAGHTLRKEVEMVFGALGRGLLEGRRQVARIVGRDTSELSANEVKTAALETLAENLSDGVVAPIFWFLLLGVPGMLTYKMINTMDSMIGYQNARYKDFGCWAAHIDDIANYLPARLTALLMLVANSLRKRSITAFFPLWKFVRTFGPEHASPNSGWPEAALAGILDCQFGGPHNYFGEKFNKPYIGTHYRDLDDTDLHTSISVCLGAEIACILLTTVILCLCTTLF